jgi:hypothetical protein
MTWLPGPDRKVGGGLRAQDTREIFTCYTAIQHWRQFLLEECTVSKRSMQQDPSAAEYSVPSRSSFIVRISREGDGGGWQGWVQHTRSGESSAVQTLEALWAFIEQQAGTLPSASRKGLK